MTVIWSDLAVEDLNDIEQFIARDNPERAVSFIMELIDCAESLGIKGQEKKGTLAKWINNPAVRELYYFQYTIVYEISGEIVYIHEVHNVAKLPRRIISLGNG